jgi:putative ABC transport system ATP-binding protein
MVVIATHDERLIPLADRTIELLPKGAPTERRPPSRLPLEAGQVLFEQGIPSDFVYVVDEGEIELLRDRADKTRETVRVVGPGGYFGELGPLLGLPRSASARARTAAVVTAHSPREFKRLSKPDSAQKVASPPTSSADGGG